MLFQIEIQRKTSPGFNPFIILSPILEGRFAFGNRRYCKRTVFVLLINVITFEII